MLFVVTARFAADGEKKRVGLRDQFSDHLASRTPRIHLGGPLTNEKGERTGVLLIMEASDRASIDHYLSVSPYTRAALYERVDIDVLEVEVGRFD